jgi:hypothetical protein
MTESDDGAVNVAYPWSPSPVEGWELAIRLMRPDRPGGKPIAPVDASVLIAMRARWERNIDAGADGYFLTFVRKGLDLATRPGHDRVVVAPRWFDAGTPGQLATVALVRYQPRRSLATSGGEWTVGGDVCQAAALLIVLDSYLVQIAEPGVGPRG